MPNEDVRAMLGRRPGKNQKAFGHVDLQKNARLELATFISDLRKQCEAKKEIAFHPEDRAEDGEILTGLLEGFDGNYQPKAPWSLEKAIKEIRAKGVPSVLGAKDIEDGEWTFYVLRLKEGSKDAVLIRSHSPTYGLGPNRFLGRLVGTVLKPVEEPLIGFDRTADVLVVDSKVYVVYPDRADRLFVDAEEVKRRAPQVAKRFAKDLGAGLTAETATAVERVCSHNAPVTRRVERLIAEGNLSTVKAPSLRRALPDAGLPEDAFGKSGKLRAQTDLMARILIDVAADLYYQPRFASSSRRVGSYRNVKK
jgi:hypothetical protein